MGIYILVLPDLSSLDISVQHQRISQSNFNHPRTKKTMASAADSSSQMDAPAPVAAPAPSKTKKTAAKKTQKPVPEHPPFNEMVMAAVIDGHPLKGVSLHAIKKIRHSPVSTAGHGYDQHAHQDGRKKKPGSGETDIKSMETRRPLQIAGQKGGQCQQSRSEQSRCEQSEQGRGGQESKDAEEEQRGSQETLRQTEQAQDAS